MTDRGVADDIRNASCDEHDRRSEALCRNDTKGQGGYTRVKSRAHAETY